MTPLYVTGTDTGVGKTRVTAALALAARTHADDAVTIVKLVQTGVTPDERGDAAEAAALAGCEARELRRFFAAADPWNAAVAQRYPPLAARPLAEELSAIRGIVVAEGSGGAAVPLNASETISDVARAAGASAVIVVGLRLGCISHTLLTLHYLSALGMPVRAAILCEPFGATGDAYRAEVERALDAKVRIGAFLAYDPEPARSVARAALQLASLWPAEHARRK